MLTLNKHYRSLSWSLSEKLKMKAQLSYIIIIELLLCHMHINYHGVN